MIFADYEERKQYEAYLEALGAEANRIITESFEKRGFDMDSASDEHLTFVANQTMDRLDRFTNRKFLAAQMEDMRRVVRAHTHALEQLTAELKRGRARHPRPVTGESRV